jgi:sporulation protein YlmC with PRC-barrel domain
MPDVNEVQGWRDRTVIDADGDKVGKLEEIYMDEDTGKPEWGLVNTGLRHRQCGARR